MTSCQPKASTVSPLAFLAAAKRRVERRGGCCTPQHLIDAAHGDNVLHTIGGGTVRTAVHPSVLETAHESR